MAAEAVSIGYNSGGAGGDRSTIVGNNAAANVQSTWVSLGQRLKPGWLPKYVKGTGGGCGCGGAACGTCVDGCSGTKNDPDPGSTFYDCPPPPGKECEDIPTPPTCGWSAFVYNFWWYCTRTLNHCNTCLSCPGNYVLSDSFGKSYMKFSYVGRGVPTSTDLTNYPGLCPAETSFIYYEPQQNLGSSSGYICCKCTYNVEVLRAIEDATILGHDAVRYGGNNLAFITAIGYSAGRNVGDSTTRSLFIGPYTGYSTTGELNIFIGPSAGRLSTYNLVSSTFILGNENHKNWLVGDISSTGNLYVDGVSLLVMSSKTLKTDIVPFEDYEEALEDIVQTPLFTYKYKNHQDFPDKSRWGVVSEELPKHLQLRGKGKFSFPDWPSIYGSFWAGLKALYERLISLEEMMTTEFKSVFKPYDQMIQLVSEIQEGLVKFKEQTLSEVGEFIKEFHSFKGQEEENLRKARQELRQVVELKQAFREQLAEIHRRIELLENSQQVQ